MMIQRYELKTIENETIVIVHLDPQLTEFSSELGKTPEDKVAFSQQIRTTIIKKFPELKITAIKVMSGSLLVSSIYLGGGSSAFATTTTSTNTTTAQVTQDIFDMYTVRSGDSLFLIARQHNVSVAAIKEVNNLRSDLIFVGQILRMPYFTYTVMSGDSLSKIARKYDVTLNELRSFNNLTSDLILVGQKLRVPRTASSTASAPTPSPTPTEPTPPPVVETTINYTVVSGDSLSVIARRFDTTVTEIRTLNGLTSDLIRVGQVLRIPQKTAIVEPAPSPTPPPTPTPPVEQTTFNYTVVSGDSLSVIARRFETTVTEIRTLNGLTSDLIRVGQVLRIPQKTAVVEPAPTPAPEPTPDPTPPVEETTFNYTVVSGDSLSVIARRFDTSVSAIKTRNSLTSDLIRVGQVLIIPQKVVVQDPPAPPPEEVLPAPVTPSFLLLDPMNSINSESYTIVGETSPNSTVAITLTDKNNKNLTRNITSNSVGRFETTFNVTSLEEGNIEVKAVATNSQGKQSEPIRTTIVKDTIIDVPKFETTAPFVNGKNQDAFQVTGWAEPNGTVFLTISDAEDRNIDVEIPVGENGNFVSSIDVSNLADSDLIFRVKQRDAAGNVSQSQLHIVEKDTSHPDVPVLEAGGVVNNQNVATYTFEGTTEANATVYVTVTDDVGERVSGSIRSDKTGQFRLPMNLTSLRDGELKVEIKQSDRAGNESEIGTQTLQKVTAMPDLALDPIGIVNSRNAGEFLISGETVPESEVKITVSDGNSELTDIVTAGNSGAFTIPLNLRFLTDGELQFSFVTIDRNGNKSEAQTFTTSKDTVAPANLVIADLTTVNSVNQGAYVIEGTTEDEGIVSLVITDGAITITENIAVRDDGTFRFELDLSAMLDGTLTIAITQTDTAGNTSDVEELTVDKDTVISSPTISRSGYAFEGDRILYNVAGVAEPLSTIFITVDDQSGRDPITIEHTVNERGIFNLDVNISDLDLSRALLVSISQSDAAGNVSEVLTPDFLTHTVVSGDTLSHIAKHYNTTAEAIRRLNGINGDLIRVGDVLRLPVTASTTLNLGYLYFGHPNNFSNQVLATERSFNVVSPSYFDVNPDGTLKVTWLFDPTFIKSMNDQGIRVVPFLSNHWDRELGRAMLENREQAAQQIADMVIRYDLGGVNVDLENINHEDRDNFTDFVRLLREKIPSSKEVSVAVAANPNGWNTGWHGAYDYTALARYADYLMIMTYDESYHGGPVGPVASLPWVERSIQYAIAQGVPKDKIVIGLAHYGRFWREGAATGGHGISNFQIQEMLRKYEHTVTFDSASQSVKAVVTIRENDPKTYIMGNALVPGTYTIWFENDESYRAKVALVEKYGIRGVGHWSIGQENRDVWNNYHTFFLPKDTQMVPVNPAPPEPLPYFTYTVVSGDSLWRLAVQNNTTIAAIKELNNLTSDTIFVGQTLKIPR